MRIQYRNGARLFEPTATTQFLCTFQPRMPWAPSTANGGFKSDESGNGFDLNLGTGTDNILGVGPVPGTYAAYLNGSTNFKRPGHDAALYVTGDVTMEAYFKCGDGAWSALADVFGFSGAPNDSEAENYNLTMGIDTTGRHPKYFHEGTSGVDYSYTWTDISLPVFEWTYMAMVRDATALTVTLYINGVAHPDVYSYGTNPTGGGNAFFAVGSNGTHNLNYFRGWLAGIRIRSEAATAADIASTWARISPNSSENLRPPEVLPETNPDQHANVTVYHEAPQHDTDDGDVVTTPTLLAGANGVTQATAGERPYILTAGGASGWKMWDDISQNKFFDGTTLSSYIQESPARYHAFCAFTLHGASRNSTTLNANHRLFGGNLGTWGVYAHRANTGGAFQVYGLHNDGVEKSAAFTVDRYQIHLAEFWYDSGTSEMVFRIDDETETRVSAGALGAGGSLEIGGDATHEFQGVLHSVMIGSDFDADTQAGIRNYYANKYRIRV